MSQAHKTESKVKKWAVNIVIVVVTIIAMLVLTEVAFRIIDGYQTTQLELRQDTVNTQPLD